MMAGGDLVVNIVTRDLLLDLKKLRRRMVEIDYRYKHRHLPGSLSALPIIIGIYLNLDLDNDVFILSKGHSCAALYAVLEALGFKPDCTKVHPERDPANGVTMTAGSLGHGLPTAVGIAWAKQYQGKPGIVHVLLGGGECQEGTTWEALHLVDRFQLENLRIHIDHNRFQGSDSDLYDCVESIMMLAWETLFLGDMICVHETRKGEGIKMFEDDPVKSVHLVTDDDYARFMEELA